jgi:hypothetical protein
MPLVDLTVAHGRTMEEARRRLDSAVQEVAARFGTMIRHVEWNDDRSRVTLDGAGLRVQMWVDERDVHALADIPALGALLGGPLAAAFKQIVQRTFQKQLP